MGMPYFSCLEWTESFSPTVPSTERAADVVLRVLLAGIAEDPLGVLVLDKITRSATRGRIDIEESGAVRDALGLLQVVRDDDDGKLLFEFPHQFLDLACRDRVESGTRFVHE